MDSVTSFQYDLLSLELHSESRPKSWNSLAYKTSPGKWGLWSFDIQFSLPLWSDEDSMSLWFDLLWFA